MNYLVFHDNYMDGAMDVYLCPDNLDLLKNKAQQMNKDMEANGADDCGVWDAYSQEQYNQVSKNCKVWQVYKEGVATRFFW